MPQYTIQCFIPVGDPDEEEVYGTLEEAREVLEHCELMQPENKYEIVEIEEG